MASELSRFIGELVNVATQDLLENVQMALLADFFLAAGVSVAEDELKSQGIQDDEEQRLLSNLRVKVSAASPARLRQRAAQAHRPRSTPLL